jgi:hypothetical protein
MVNALRGTSGWPRKYREDVLPLWGRTGRAQAENRRVSILERPLAAVHRGAGTLGRAGFRASGLLAPAAKGRKEQKDRHTRPSNRRHPRQQY